ncbi:MAG: AAA family ATPase [Candidatus Aminicenantes bacterium]|nr:AAA family ATPase [Candidatus Aminicenantes bacterium]
MFRLKEDPSLDGTFKVFIKSEKPLSLGSFVLLKYKNLNSCAAAVDSISAGSGEIWVDRFLRYRLGCPIEADIEVETFQITPAKKAEIFVPQEFIGNAEGQNWIKKNLLNKPLTQGLESQFRTLTNANPIVISKVFPSPYALFDETTAVEFKSLDKTREESIGITWETIGGLGPAKEKVRELVEYPVQYPDIMRHIGIEPPKGILLFGPPGTGKTLIAKALQNELKAHFEVIQGPEIMSALYGESEKKLREKFDRAIKEAAGGKPSIILIDEIDSLVPKREGTKGELESRLVATLLSLMDGLKETKKIIVIGTTNRPNAIDPALRRPGRFEYEIYIGLPDVPGRKEILEIHTTRLRKMPLADDVDLQELAHKTHGFTGADLSFLCREAGRNTFRRFYLSKMETAEEPPENVPESKIRRLLDILPIIEDPTTPPELRIDAFLKSVKVTKADFDEALSAVSPSGMREVLVEIPRDITWDKIGGLKDVKNIIQENVIHGIKNPGIFKEMGIKPARGILFNGPPGTGKTLMAKALANECGANFIAVKGPELRSKWFGESEEKVRFIFDTARRHAPCVVFLDEVDALTPSRGADASGVSDSIVNQFLAEMDGIQSAEGVFVIGATNRMELIDAALLRPGRFDYQVLIPLPDEEARQEVFNIHLKKDVLARDVSVGQMARRTDGFSGAEIAEVCRLAGLKALREVDFKEPNLIRGRHLDSAIEEVKKRTAAEADAGAAGREPRLPRIAFPKKVGVNFKEERYRVPSRRAAPAWIHLVVMVLAVVLSVIAYLVFPARPHWMAITLAVLLASNLLLLRSKFGRKRERSDPEKKMRDAGILPKADDL